MTASRGDTTRNELKRAARRLFAERGIAAVGMRDILDAAGQRNAAAVHYYFGGKDELLRELVVDGARAIDARRRAMLDARGGERASSTLDDVVRAMIVPNIEHRRRDRARARPTSASSATCRPSGARCSPRPAGSESPGYARCLDHVRRLLAHLPLAVVNQRLLFAGLALQAILEAREAALDGADAREHPYWTREGALDAIVDAIKAILLGAGGAG